MATALDTFTSAAPLARARAVAEGLPVRAVRDLVADPAFLERLMVGVAAL